MKQALINHFRNILDFKTKNFTFYDWVSFENMLSQILSELGYAYNLPEPFEDEIIQKSVVYSSASTIPLKQIKNPNLILSAHESFRTLHSDFYYK